MYSEIEQIFKTNGQYSKPKKIILLAFILWATSFILIIIFCGTKMNSPFWTIFLTCVSSVIIPAFSYAYVIFHIKNEKDFKEKNGFLDAFILAIMQIFIKIFYIIQI